MILHYIWFGIFSLIFPLAGRLFINSIDQDDYDGGYIGLLGFTVSIYSAVSISWDFVTAPLFLILLDFLPDTGSLVNAISAGIICASAWLAYGAIILATVDLGVYWWRRARFPQPKLNPETTKQLFEVLAINGGGIYKRIDENRELVELLQNKAPELVSKNPWVLRWLEAQDDFLCDIESAIGEVETIRFKKSNRFPRTRPDCFLAIAEL